MPHVSCALPRTRFAVCLLLLLCISACGGAAGSEPFEAAPAPPSPGTPSGPTTPAPTPPAPSAWNPDALSYARTALFGSFPSGLVRHGTTLFASDADQIEVGGAKILPIDIGGASPVASTAFSPVTITAAALVDSNGNPGDLSNPVGFGFFLNEILIVSDTLGFVLVNAGGSDSLTTLSNLIAFDPTSGSVLQVLDLANLFVSPASLSDSAGFVVPNDMFVQAGAEGLEYVPTSTSGGLLFVAMTNLIFGAPSYGTVKYPGTIQVFAVNAAGGTPATPTSDPVHATRTLVTSHFNPVAIRRLSSLSGERILVTCAGTTGYDASYNLVPVTPSAVEAFDATSGSYVGMFSMGLAGLSGIRPAIGTDGAGHLVGFYPSSVTGEVYLIRLDGLTSLFLDPSRLAVLRGPGTGIPITAAQAGQPGGNITGVALSPDGRTLVVSGFGDLFTGQPGRVFLLGLPADVVTGSGFGATFTPGSTEFASVAGRTTGELAVVPNAGSGPDVYVNVGGPLDGTTFLGTGPATLGTLDTGGTIR